jgi:hypothetical protein
MIDAAMKEPVTIFDYPTILTNDQSTFAVDYADHHRWLTVGQMGFKVSTFRFPDFVSPRSQLGLRLRFYRIEMDNAAQAALFALYSSMVPAIG